jgi:hypothetical protein
VKKAKCIVALALGLFLMSEARADHPEVYRCSLAGPGFNFVTGVFMVGDGFKVEYLSLRPVVFDRASIPEAFVYLINSNNTRSALLQVALKDKIVEQHNFSAVEIERGDLYLATTKAKHGVDAELSCYKWATTNR